MHTILTFLSRVFAFMKQNVRMLAIVVGVLVVVLGIGGYLAYTKPAPEPETEDEVHKREVSVASVRELSAAGNALQVLGRVVSENEAIVRTESSGEVIRLYKKLGDRVGNGELIAELENSVERAALLQAQGAYESAQAGASVSDLSLTRAEEALMEEYISARATLSSAYATLDDAVSAKSDFVFSNPDSSLPKLNVTLANSQLAVDLENGRPAVGARLLAMNARQVTTTDGALPTLLTDALNDASAIRAYLDSLNAGLASAIPNESVTQSTIDSYRASAALARTNVVALISSISSAKDSLAQKKNALAVAQSQASGNGSSIVTAADASVKQALGNLRAAEARLEKTRLRSPIAGTINNLSINRGDFVSAFTEAAVVANNATLEVRAFLNEIDAKTLTLGDNVLVEGTATGTVSRIAPALDPKTRKIEVRVALQGAPEYSNGSYVRVTLLRSGENDEMLVPITALKITPEGPIVFTVRRNTLVANPISEGLIRGENIVVLEGLTFETSVVTDARGLKEGEKIEVRR